MMRQGKRKKEEGEMRENEEGQVKGAPNLPNAPQLLEEKLGWTTGFQRGQGCCPT